MTGPMVNLLILPILTGATVAAIVGFTDNGWPLALGMGAIVALCAAMVAWDEYRDQ
jgi:1,4-dihydroxy-2-naphthoate octaprenyltransferase